MNRAVEDSRGESLYPGDVVLSSSGALDQLRNQDFQGVTAMKDSWFNSLTKVSNFENFVKARVSVTIGELDE